MCRPMPPANGHPIGIKHLHFVLLHEVDAAVAEALAVAAARDDRRRPLDVQLCVAEGCARADVTCTRRDFEVTVFDFPPGRPSRCVGPCRQRTAIRSESSTCTSYCSMR